MKKSLALVVAAFAAAPVLAAADTCVVGTLSSYIALGAKGCNVDSVHFSNFAYRMTIPGVPADKIEVRPFFAATTGGSSQLKFTGMWHAFARQVLESVITYNVAFPITVGPVAERGQIGLHLGPDRIDGTVGAIQVVEKTEPGSLLVYDQRGPYRFKRDDRLAFTPPSLLKTAEAHITVSGGDGGALATYFAAMYQVVRVTTTP
jgi:hypothetical protein